MTTDDDNDIGPGNFALMRSLIAEGKPDRQLSRQALATFCRIARAQGRRASPFPLEMLDWIADAFERHLSDEAPDIAKSLGLNKPRGRQVDAHIEGRNWEIAARVVRLIDERHGGQLTDNDEGEGIFADVAEEFGINEGVVRDVWYQVEERAVWARADNGELVGTTERVYPMRETGRIMLRLIRMLEASESKAPGSPKSQD